jgi:hypothetical protein
VGLASVVGRVKVALTPEMGGQQGFLGCVVYSIKLQTQGAPDWC